MPADALIASLLMLVIPPIVVVAVVGWLAIQGSIRRD